MLLKRLKESNPLEVEEFATATDIADEAAFCWQIPCTLRRRERIIATVNKLVKRTSQKYSVEVPTAIEHAYRIDRVNKNTFWRDAINKEMTNLTVAFDILREGQSPSPGYTKASGHIIFDFRMTLERKARCGSIRIAQIYAALNELPIL